MPVGKTGVAVVVVLIVTVLLGLVATTAQGAPGSPTASTGTVIAPSTAATAQVTFVAQVYSAVAPNTFSSTNAKFTYSATYTNAMGGKSILSANQSVTASVLASTGNLYKIGATVSFSLPAICSSACSAVVANLTITLQAVVASFFGTFYSPVVTVQFSSASTANIIPAAGAAPTSAWSLEFWSLITFILATDFTVIGLAVRFPLWIVGILLYLVWVVELVTWGIIYAGK